MGGGLTFLNKKVRTKRVVGTGITFTNFTCVRACVCVRVCVIACEYSAGQRLVATGVRVPRRLLEESADVGSDGSTRCRISIPSSH